MEFSYVRLNFIEFSEREVLPWILISFEAKQTQNVTRIPHLSQRRKWISKQNLGDNFDIIIIYNITNIVYSNTLFCLKIISTAVSFVVFNKISCTQTYRFDVYYEKRL